MKDVPLGPSGLPWAGPRFNEHMPFPGHRTVAEFMEDEARRSILRRLGK